MTKFAKIAAVAVVALGGFAFASVASAVSASSIYSPATGFLRMGSGMGSMAYQAPQVMAAQTALNACVPGMALAIDGKMGPLTTAKFKAFQASKMIAQDGIIGPITAGQLAACSGDNSSNNGGSTNNGTTLNGGETSIESFEMSSEDDAEEGEEKLVATIKFDVEDADAMIDRLDLSFFPTSTPSENEPWEAFETITLMVDGKEIASEDIDEENDWLEEDYVDANSNGSYDSGNDSGYIYRLTGLGYVVEEGEEGEIEVYLTANSNVDDAGTDADWTIFVDDAGMRAVDGAGIHSTFGDDSETVTFSVDTEGGNESIEIKTSSKDPQASLLKVEEDEESDWYEVFTFRLETEENDIELDNLVLEVITTGGDYEDLVNDMIIEIDGEEVDDFSVVDGNTTSADVTFDIDGDVTIDGDDVVDVVVKIEFKKADQDNDGAADGAYDDTGVETVQVGVRSVDGEGVDDVSDTATINGKAHTLTYAAAEITNVSWSATPNPNGGNGTLDFFFTVDNSDGDEDFDVLVASIADTITGATFDDTAGVPETADFGVLSRVSGDSVATLGGNAGFTVAEGDTARFRVRYTAVATGTYEATITEVSGVEIADDKELSPTLVI